MNKKCLYIECPSGISGDMTIGAFLDLEIVTIDELKGVVDELNISNIEITSTVGEKCGITGRKFDVILSEKTHHHHHHETHSHDHNHDEKNHHHANLPFINSLIDLTNLDIEVKELSKRIFMHVARSESKIHGKSLDEVHFHEVGAFDSIVDIVLSAYCVIKADVDKIYVSNIHIGTGHVKCDHGILPVPAPATMDILKGLPVYTKNIKSELVTPTGAAILKEIGDEYASTPVLRIENIGYGLGRKDLEIANVLRISICEL